MLPYVVVSARTQSHRNGDDMTTRTRFERVSKSMLVYRFGDKSRRMHDELSDFRDEPLPELSLSAYSAYRFRETPFTRRQAGFTGRRTLHPARRTIHTRRAMFSRAGGMFQRVKDVHVREAGFARAICARAGRRVADH